MARKICLFIVFLLLPEAVFCQASNEYNDWVNKAMSYYEAQKFQESAEAFSHAFAANGGMAGVNDRYNAACSWARAGNKDSAFYHLNRLAEKGSYIDFNHLLVDFDLTNLHDDKRWQPLCAHLKEAKEKAEANYNKPVVAILDAVLEDDQGARSQIEEAEKKYGRNSREVFDLWKTMRQNDSIDLIKVEKILDKYGWLGPDEIGINGNATLFLVIQHSDHTTQEKYLPVMRQAVKIKKAAPDDLALLEDRVALGEGRMQFMAASSTGDTNGGYWLSPLEDPENVDKRRAEVGLEPLASYLNRVNIKWDVEEYKKQLPEIIKKEGWKK